MVGASWRLARTMLGEIGTKMGPRSTKIAQDGSKKKTKRLRQRSWGRLGAKLGSIIFSKTRLGAMLGPKVTATDLGRRQRRGPGEGKGGEIPTRMGL